MDGTKNMPTLPFQFVGNNLALDFVNTRIVLQGVQVDLLSTPEQLVSWLATAGIDFDSNIDEKDLKQVDKLREAISRLITAFRRGDEAPTASLSVFNSYLLRRKRVQQLECEDSGFCLKPAEVDRTLSSILGEIATSTADLLTTTPATKIRKCEGADCVLVFKDISRTQKRRWCSMEVCGNRAKAATHYKQKKT